jgi:N-acetylglucosamine kinase-like BadF-type ATPase
MGLFLAIDAGGTKTECVLADEARVLARANAGTVKMMRVGEEVATALLRGMLEEVAAKAGVSLREVTRTCFGLAGVSSGAVREWAERVMAEMVGGVVEVCGDEEIALDAAFRGGPGILVIAGTGSNAIGRGVSGRLVSAGGWGPMLGDEGSGFWIGLEAIRAALRERDRSGVSSRLLGEIERDWGLGSLGELVAVANRRGGQEGAVPDLPALAPVVARCAEQGDALAGAVLQRAGEELAELVRVVFQRLGAAEMEVAYTGSVLGRVGAVRAAMVAKLAISVSGARVREGAVDPLEGALWRARKASY